MTTKPVQAIAQMSNLPLKKRYIPIDVKEKCADFSFGQCCESAALFGRNWYHVETLAANFGKANYASRTKEGSEREGSHWIQAYRMCCCFDNLAEDVYISSGCFMREDLFKASNAKRVV